MVCDRLQSSSRGNSIKLIFLFVSGNYYQICQWILNYIWTFVTGFVLQFHGCAKLVKQITRTCYQRNIYTWRNPIINFIRTLHIICISEFSPQFYFAAFLWFPCNTSSENMRPNCLYNRQPSTDTNWLKLCQQHQDCDMSKVFNWSDLHCLLMERFIIRHT